MRNCYIVFQLVIVAVLTTAFSGCKQTDDPEETFVVLTIDYASPKHNSVTITDVDWMCGTTQNPVSCSWGDSMKLRLYQIFADNPKVIYRNLVRNTPDTFSISSLEANTTYVFRVGCYRPGSDILTLNTGIDTLTFTTTSPITQWNLDAIPPHTLTTIDLSADVVIQNPYEVKLVGFCWSTIPGPTINDAHKTFSGSSYGPFSYHVKNLTPATTYYIRAYCKYSKTGSSTLYTEYSNEITVITN